jgi:molybdopterin-guanine dinucleotide biosynthesis protein
MLTIGVGGGHSNSGKTEVVCRILPLLPGWGAVKCTRTPLYSAVIDDPLTLAEEDKDTGRYLAAGAAAVLWVQTTAEDVAETMGVALARLSHLPGVIVEGNSAIEVSHPDIVIFTCGDPGRMKSGADRVLRQAHVVFYRGRAPEVALVRPGAIVRESRDWRGVLEYLEGACHGRDDRAAAS